MDGIHDLGGKHGFGAVAPEADEPVFHERWEAVVFAMTRALRGVAVNNTDQFRHAIERIDPRAYLGHGYYGRWLAGLETMAVEAGVITQEDVTARERNADSQRVEARAPNAVIGARPQLRGVQWPANAAAGGARRPLAAAPRFAIGQDVRAVAHGVEGHTRLPAYARNRRGTVVAWHQGWVFPDTHAHGLGEQPQHLYTVAFTSEELWGVAGEQGTVVHLDLFEPYLQHESRSPDV